MVRVVVRALAHHMRQHRHIAPGHHRPRLAAHRLEQDFAGPLGGVVSVDMRVGAVTGHHRRVVDDRVVQVGMHVERHGDRRRGIDGANAAQQLAFTVLTAFGHHRAVQVEHDAVIAALCHGIADHAGDVLEGGIVDRSARRRPGGDRQHHLGPLARRQVEIGADARPGPFVRRDRRLAVKRPRAMAKARQRGRHRREGVGLMLHHRDQQAHRTVLHTDAHDIVPAPRP
jgi:hypothetical protein